ncbi:hypothetical protein C8Q80DRAFT_899615 [Daedaleopsis nitida]|nr:hypothetical protein C8Q80DRAFT_899615 [Daedaleopsis nitida]
MYWLSILRVIVIVWASLCAVALLGVGAHGLSVVPDLNGLPVFAWECLGIVTTILALVSLPCMLIIDLLRTGAFTSMIVVELAWLGFLGVMMLATGGAAAASASNFWVQCSVWYPAAARTVCSETSAAAALGFLGFFPLCAYAFTLLVFSLVQAHRGNYIWQRSVKEMQLQGSDTVMGPISAPGAFNSSKPHETAALNVNAGQYGYPSQQGVLSPQTTGYVSSQATGYNQSQPMPQATPQSHPGMLVHPASQNPTSPYPQV